MLVRSAVVVAVVDAVAHVVFGDAAAVVAGELSFGVAGPEQAAHLVAVVPAVVIVVAAVVVGHAAAVATGDGRRGTGVEGWEYKKGTVGDRVGDRSSDGEERERFT